METIEKLPAGEAVIGAKEVIKNIKTGSVKIVVVARNCPQFLIDRIEGAGKVKLEKLDGDQNDLAVRLGKPFPIAVAGFKG